MTASLTDKFARTYNSGNPNVARVTSSRAAAGSNLVCDNLAGWPTDTVVQFSTYKINTSNAVVAGSQIDWKGIVSGNTIGSLTRVTGATDSGSDIGDVVEMNPTANWADQVVQGILTQHNQDGTHGAITATSATATGTVQGATVISTGDIQHRSISLETIRAEQTFDYIASGCVWSGDSYGSTRAASMTAGVAYIGGKRLVISAVTARTFTASKDTYIDVNNSGTITYTEVANNAASPALSASNIRLGIIVTGASNIANAGSVNQGEETKVLPIASSVPYAVTDSLGNLICPRDPSRKILGYRRITGDFVTAALTSTQVTGLSCPVIIPTGRKVKITLFSPRNSVNALANSFFGIWLGTVGSGTELVTSVSTSGGGGYYTPQNIEYIYTSSTASVTFNGEFHVSANTGTVSAASTYPTYIKVELV